MKNPEEIVRCLRICRNLECADQEGTTCSYKKVNETTVPFSSGCVYSLLGDAADALAASYSYKKGVNNE